MDKVISGIKTAKKDATPLYKVVFGFIMAGVIVGLSSLFVAGKAGEVVQGAGHLFNSVALALLTYNARVNIKANNLAYATGIMALVFTATGLFYILK